MNDDILLIDLETLPAGQPTELFPGFAAVEQTAAINKKKRGSGSRKKRGQEAANDSESIAVSGENSGAQIVSGDIPLDDVSGNESIGLHQALPVDVFVSSHASMPDSSTKSPETNHDATNVQLSGEKMNASDARVANAIPVHSSELGQSDQKVSPDPAIKTRKRKGKTAKKFGKSPAQHYRDMGKVRKEFVREDLRVPADVFGYVEANVGECKTFPSKQAGYVALLWAGLAVFLKGKTN